VLERSQQQMRSVATRTIYIYMLCYYCRGFGRWLYNVGSRQSASVPRT